VAARVHRHLAGRWFLVLAWRVLSGYRRDARPGRVRRAAVRSGATAAMVAVVAGWLASPTVTSWVVAGAAGAAVVAGAALIIRWAWMWRHRRRWLRPLHLAAHEVAQVDRRRAPHQWLEVAPDRSRAVLALPAGFPAEDRDKQRLAAIASAKLGMEDAQPQWRLAGPKPQLMLLPSPAPPPVRVTLPDIRTHLERAKADELVWGIGKQGRVVKSSLSGDSPHVGLSMGSGAGKSVSIRGLLTPMLYRGCIGLILDVKMISHQWATALPNVAIVRRPHEIHAALLWLQREAMRRNEVALAGSDIEGNVNAVVGPRLIVVCEELNATMSTLKAFWRQERNGDKSLPSRSPALDALDFVNLTGRQVLMNLIYMGQRLSVKAIGGDGDARESIGVVALGRYKPPAWKMLAADFPMPPPSLRPGRIQVVSDEVRECQAPFLSAREARALATAGDVAPLPAGMPGARVVPGTVVPAVDAAPDLGVSHGTGTLLPPRVTLREWAESGASALSVGALRKASQRPGFPDRAGVRGMAGEWLAAELAEWEAMRR